jgi:Sulfatase
VRAWAVLLAGAVAMAGCSFGEDEPARTEKPPVVVLILDEFPADAILRPDGQIDAERFPNFAALARISTWFPNGHTVYDSTFKSVPAILDARLPRPRTAADVRSHQPSVFHLMHGLGYDVVKVESGSAVCPPWICLGARTRRPGVLARLSGGGRPARLQKWIGAIRRRPHPTFYFQHTLLPHEPWIYLPSGRASRPSGEDPIEGVNRWIGFHDPGLTDHNHLRHLLQVGYVDRQLGRLLRRLRRTRLLERALLIVAADHGYSFDLGVLGRRRASETNIEEIAPVPFFVKAPGQMEGDVDESLVRTVDIVPTIADLLGTRVYWRHDGRSAFSEATAERRVLRLPSRSFARTIEIGVEELERRRRTIRRRRARTFGTGLQSLALFGDPWAAAYRIGPNRELLGRRVSELRVRSFEGVRARVANAALAADLRPEGEARSIRVHPTRARSIRVHPTRAHSTQIHPTRVTGALDGGPPGRVRDLAVAVNGRVRAVGRSFRLRRRPREYFSMLVPEDSLRRGRNELELFEVRAGGELVPLAPAARQGTL